MSPLALAAFLAILAHQGQLNIERIDAPVMEIHTLAGATVKSEGAYGWTECTSGHVDRIVWDGDQGALFHELLHGVDCIDDGQVNGSLLPYKPWSNDPAHEWVGYGFSHEAEAIQIIQRIGGH